MDFIQTLGAGILIGLVYGLLGLGLVIVYKASEAFNFAVAEFLVIGSFLFYYLHFGARIPFLIAFPLGLAAAAIFGAIVERLSIKPLLGRSALSMTIVTLGLSSLLRGLSQAVFGSYPYTFSLTLPDISIDLETIFYPSGRIWAGIISILAFIVVLVVIFRTRWGIFIRATSENQAKALAYGIDARFILLLVWAISSATIAVAGIMVSNFGALSILTGVAGFRAIPVVLIGGLDSIKGALVGGLIVGICEALTGSYLESFLGLVGFKDVAPYLLLLIVLIIRPYGLFGTVRIERV